MNAKSLKKLLKPELENLGLTDEQQARAAEKMISDGVVRESLNSNGQMKLQFFEPLQDDISKTVKKFCTKNYRHIFNLPPANNRPTFRI